MTRSDVFICFAEPDFKVASSIVLALEEKGARCWFAPRDLVPGTNWSESVRDAIGSCRVLVFVGSDSAHSLNVVSEVEFARSRGIPIIDAPAATPISPDLLNELAAKVMSFVVPEQDHRPNSAAMAQLDYGSAEEEEEGRPGSPQLSGSLTDLVHFAVTAPATVAPGASFLVDVWAHLEGDREEVFRRARQAARTGDILFRERGPVRIARGSAVTLRLLPMEGFSILDKEDTLYWEGAIGNAGFPVTVEKDAAAGSRHGTLCVFLDKFMVAKIHFVIDVGLRVAAPALLPTEAKYFRTAFASYASDDREQVLRIIQGLQKAAPDLNIFLDVASLRSGQRWEEELWNIIPTRDVFYLFWSRAAILSEWVDKEWRCALSSRGLDFINPTPLEGPHTAPPPAELRRLHFNDWILAYFRSGIGIHE